MIDVERRLHHAARELREIEIEPPPLEHLGHRRRSTGAIGRIPALVMPVLFVLGGLAVVAGGLDRHGDGSDAAAAVETTAVIPQDVVAVAGRDDDSTADTEPALTARQEIALISSLGPDVRDRPEAPPVSSVDGAAGAPAPPPADDVRTLSQRYR